MSEAMNPVDATLWAIRRDPQLRTTIVALALLDRTTEWEVVAASIRRAIQRIPRLRQRVEEPSLGVGRPHWVAAEPDLNHHLRRVRSPDGGGLRAVLDLCGALAGEDFDAARPLWEVVVVEGLDDDRSAVVLKVSHALTDGVGGVGLLRLLGDDVDDDAFAESTAERPPVADSERHRLAELLSLPSGLVSAAVHAGLHPVATVEEAASVVGSAGRLLSPAGPPLSPLMTERGLARWVGVSELDLERLRRAAHRAGGTINDAFVTVAMGALADYHAELGADGRAFRVTMPVSFRSDGDADGGNQWTPARVVLEVDRFGHPYDELQLYRAVLRAATHEPAISFTHGISAGVQQLPAALTSGIVAGMVKGCDAALTDVPGLREGLRIGGAEVTHLYPFAPTGGAALNIGLLSLGSTACIGVTADVAAVTEPELLVRCFDERAADFLRRRRVTAPTPSPEPSPESEPAAPAVAEHDRLSALDTSFLRMESANTPMHMGVIGVFDGRSLLDDDGVFDLDRFAEYVERRLVHAPRLTRKLEEVPLELGRPVWVEDPDFDIHNHLQLSALAAPGGRQELYELCEELQMQPLERELPLFEMEIVIGLDPDEFGPGAVAVVEKVHHALLDGMSGVELLSVLFEAEGEGDVDHARAQGRRGPRPAPVPVAPEPSSRQLVEEAIIDLAREPAELVRQVVGALRSPVETARQLSAVAGAAADLFMSRRTAQPSLNQPVGAHRRLQSITVSLDTVHETGVSMGGTVNDVVLAAVTRGLRALFEHREETVEGIVKALVPVSTRHVGMDEEHGNHVAALLVELPIEATDPISTFVAVSTRVRELKEHHHADGTEVLLDVTNHVPPVAVDLVSRLVGQQHVVNLVVTNLPGPPRPLHVMGGSVRELIPIVPLGGNLTLSVAILSYCGELVLAFHADRDACPDVDVMARATADAFAEMEELAGRT